MMRIRLILPLCVVFATLLPRAAHTQERVRVRAGDTVRCVITARDARGNIVRGWRQSGSTVQLTLRNSAARTDTSTRSWSSDPWAFTRADMTSGGAPLAAVAANDWLLPPSAFVDGAATVRLVHTRADTGVVLAVTSPVPFHGDVTGPMDFVAGPLDNFLVDLTPATSAGEQVYRLRPYEVIISPRDRWCNVLDTAVHVRLTARFPGDFASGGGWYPGDIPIRGATTFLFISNTARIAPAERQWLRAYLASDPSVRGETAPYEVLDHAPRDFSLQWPRDGDRIDIYVPTRHKVFSWERPDPCDPVTEIRGSRSGSVLISDTVTYTVVLTSQVRSLRIASDSGGLLPRLTLLESQISELLRKLGFGWTTHSVDLVWSVEATDGLYITHSTPAPGNRLELRIPPGGVGVTEAGLITAPMLAQNYPNPFNPSTTIDFTTTLRGPVRLRVFDIRGVEVALLADGEADPGPHQARFEAAGLPAGIYSCRLEAEGATLSKWMVLLK